MSDKPVVLVTRRVPSKVEARVAADFDARLNRADRLYSTEELLNRAEGADAILCCHTEHFTAEVIDRLPASVKAIAKPMQSSAAIRSTSPPRSSTDCRRA
jgi:lactate dehydrogenase-like 2-hydroxyacid dehydrogenase